MERYESLGLVGEGSYGTVLKCRHRDSGRLVAIKKFMDSDDDKTVKKIALREIKLLRQLRHDNLVNLIEVWKRRRRWYLVFEFVERTLLDDLEQNSSGMDLNTTRQYLYQILRAAAFCHQQNIIHRDIKPENILISQGGVVKLCDFGFARTMISPAEGGVYTDYVATRWYRAPELLVGDTKYGKPVDVWAIGCLLLEMFTGQPLFPGDSDLDQLYHIVRCFGNLTAHHQELFHRNPVFSGVRLPECSGRVPLEQRFPTITPAAQDLAQSCLQMDPERRSQCSELLEHPLFTQDSFHIRFLDELNAKIQKGHRENSTLPKITKTPRRERDDGDGKNQRSKDKKQHENADDNISKEKEKKVDEKMEKTKGKHPSKTSKAFRNTSEPLMATKKSKTIDTKIIDNAAKTVSMKSKPGKTTAVEPRKEAEISKSTKTLTSDLLAATTAAADPKDNGSVVVKPKQGIVASQERRGGQLKNSDTKDRDSGGLHNSGSNNTVLNVTEINVKEICKLCKSEPNQDVGKSRNNSNTKTNVSFSSKAPLKTATDYTDAHLTQKMGRVSSTKSPGGASTAVPCKMSNSDEVETSSTPSSNDHTEVTTTAVPFATKLCKTSATNSATTEIDQRRNSKCLQDLPSKPKTSSPEKTPNNMSLSNSPSKTSDLSVQFSTVVEASHIHNTTTEPEGASYSKLSKPRPSSDTKPTDNNTCAPNKPLRGPSIEQESTEVIITSKTQQGSFNTPNKDVTEDCICSKKSPDTRRAANHTEISSALHYMLNRESSESCGIHQQSTSKSKITTEPRTTSMPDEVPKTNTSVGTVSPKALKVSDKENREDLALAMSISATTTSLVNQTSKSSRSSNIELKHKSTEAEPNIKSMEPPNPKPLSGEPKTKFGSFTTSTATVTPKAQKTTFCSDSWKRRDNREKTDSANISAITDSTSFTCTATEDQKNASSRNPVPHSTDTADINDFDFSVSHSSPPPPPPPPSSTPLLLPPSSTPLIPSFSVVSTNSPTANDPLTVGSSFNPRIHNLRCIDKPRHHGGVYSRLTQPSLSSHITGSLTAQVSEKSLNRERSFLSDRCNLGNSTVITANKKKSEIHFPDLRSSVLPELRGREGKLNKGASKDQRKNKQPASSVQPSEPQQHKHNSADPQTL